MKINRIFALMAMTSVMFACNPVEQPDPTPDEEDKEQTDDPDKDKEGEKDEPVVELEGYTAVNYEAVDGGAISWDAADVIGLYPEDGAAIAYSTTADAITEEGKKAQFTGEEFEAEKVYAVYPYAEDVILVGNELELILPYEHRADKAGAPASATNLRVAVSADKTLNFYNVLGYVKVNVTASGVKEVVIRSLDPQNSLAGKASVVINDDAAPEVTVLDGVPHVILLPAEGQETIAAGVYYIPAVAASMTEGVSVRFKTDGYMYVNDMAAAELDRSGVLDCGTLEEGGSFEKFTEFVLNDDASGFTGCYREFGTSSIATAPHYLYHAGDGDVTTFWNMPDGKVSTGKAYTVDGQETIRGSYIRLDFNTASGGISKEDCKTRVDKVIFEYQGIYHPDNVELTGGHDWMPWTLDVREYNVFKKADGGLDYGTLESLTVEDSALPWTYEYNNYYVSKTYVKPYEQAAPRAYDFNGLILCCTRTRDNVDGVLQPKDAIDGVEFRDLAKELPESRWGFAELRVYGHVRN
ncbi:MAG: hypothetical protein IJ394_00455 [Bacteroidales bacterium]|nr:hypothetical protein [Bacteroidales bacterium]